MNEVESAAEIALRTNLALGARILSSAGHDDFNQGQISGRIPGSKELYIKTALTGFDEATPTDYVREPINSAQPLHRMSPPELPLHTAIYAARPDVNADRAQPRPCWTGVRRARGPGPSAALS